MAMGSLGIGYAAWTDTLYISGTITTGNWERCETGYAWGGGYATCFLDMEEIDNNAWGWTNGPLSPPATYIFDIYAGAGGCDRSKGTLVGTLTVVHDVDTVTVTYSMDEGFTMKETHLYVGTESLPRNKKGNFTVSPGQYPYKHDDLNNVTTDSYLVSVFNGQDIYVVAHAVVCWFEISPP